MKCRYNPNSRAASWLSFHYRALFHCWIPQQSHAGEFRYYFLEQLRSFTSQYCRNLGEPREVSPMVRQTIDHAGRNWITEVIKTIGIVLVAFLAARISLNEVARIRST